MRTFSTPEGMRQEIGNYIDSFADKIVRNGALTEADRTALFDRLYESGVMRVKADEFYSDMAKDLRQLRIYVNEQTRGDFGDDWNDIRKRAFAAGIYLTSSTKDRGADSIWREFAKYMPGQFDPGEIDMRTYLKYATSGTDPYDAFRIVYDLKKLEPIEGAKTVKTYQKWRVALNNTSGYTAQLKAIEAATPSTEAKHITKMKVAHDYGMDLDVYVTLKEWLPEYDENGNGSYSGAEVQAAIDGISGGALIPSGNGYAPSMKLSNKQKAALWQLFTGSKSAKNNPYDIQTGRDIIEAMSDGE